MPARLNECMAASFVSQSTAKRTGNSAVCVSPQQDFWLGVVHCQITKHLFLTHTRLKERKKRPGDKLGRFAPTNSRRQAEPHLYDRETAAWLDLFEMTSSMRVPVQFAVSGIMRLRWVAGERFVPCNGGHDKFNMVEGLSRRFPAYGCLEALLQAMFTRASAAYRRMFSICDRRVASLHHSSCAWIDAQPVLLNVVTSVVPAVIHNRHRLRARPVAGLHPMRRQIGVSQSCHQRTPASGANPCSTNSSLPAPR